MTRSAVSVRSIRMLIRDFERQHTPVGGRAATFVLGTLGLYVGAGLLWWLFTLPPTVLTPLNVWVTGQPWTSTWGWAVTAAAAAVGLAFVRAIGPVSTSAEFGFWLVAAPLDRGALLRRRVALALGCGAVVGALVGRIAAFAAALTTWVPFAVLMAAVGCSVVALSVLTQCRILPLRIVTDLIRVALLGSVAAVVAAIAGVNVPMPMNWWLVTAVGATAVAVGACAVACCGRIGAADLTAGAGTTAAVSASVTALDPSVLLGMLEQKAWQRIGRRRTRPIRGGLSRALIESDLLRHRRRPVSLLLACSVVGIVAVAPMAVTPPAVAVLQLAAVFVVTMLFSAGLRDILRERDFGALLGSADRQILLPLTVVPSVAATLVAVSTTFLSGGTAATLVIGLAGGCGAAYRVRTRPSIRYDGLILETAVGQIPVDLVRQWLRGPEVLLVAAWLTALLS
ncbi:ABC transporter permease [Rhodococcus sp. HNM0563]|uniref:DUF6297 family protein n=1 Tax=Rhodococcus sp. HNM0563 TaxID=2716339 RepID=UPI00146BA99A|nr:DUF6297 family protein [Rhodococcus sp. HNM0563]NLU63707.1 ABC transporter permease [Rhodococcus sp. HNM0563]